METIRMPASLGEFVAAIAVEFGTFSIYSNPQHASTDGTHC